MSGELYGIAASPHHASPEISRQPPPGSGRDPFRASLHRGQRRLRLLADDRWLRIIARLHAAALSCPAPAG